MESTATKPMLTLALLKAFAAEFVASLSRSSIRELFGITDAKAVGSYVEALFNVEIAKRYAHTAGSAASGIDFPELNVDLKVTSVKQPQSSSPFSSASQKVYGLAMTGGANFDIAEYMILKLIGELSIDRPTVSMLCKTSVARCVLEFAHDVSLPVARATEIRRIDAARYFGAAVDACLFSFDVQAPDAGYYAQVYNELDDKTPTDSWGVVAGAVISDLAAYQRSRYAHGRFSLEWRQGVKHDAASVMELVRDETCLRNALHDRVEIESDFVFPLAKGSDVFHGRSQADTGRFLILTQRDLQDDPERLQHSAPKLWSYLVRHETALDQRKSSIYRGKRRFSMFGVGAYTFAPYKVAVSSLHREPRFRVLGPVEGRPMVLDDTCYFVPCDSLMQAAVVAALLSNDDAIALRRSLSHPTAKRAVTKKTLQALDLRAILRRCDLDELADRALNTAAEVDCNVARPEPRDLERYLEPTVVISGGRAEQLSGQGSFL